MTSANPRDVARAFFETVDRETLAAAVNLYCAPDFKWWTPGLGDVEDKLVEFDRIMLDAIDANGVSVTIHNIIAEGEQVAVEIESRATLKTGVIYNNLYHFSMVIKGGKITRVKEYLDTKHVSDVWAGYFSGV